MVPSLPEKVPTMVPDDLRVTAWPCASLLRIARCQTKKGRPNWRPVAGLRDVTYEFPMSYESGGHEIRTRNRLPGTTFPVWAELAKNAGKTTSAENAQRLLPEIEEIAQRWPKLPKAVKAGILAMIRSGG